MVRVLFTGNSLTYVNDLPAIVAALAEAAGETPPVCRAVVGGGFSLENHWNREEARKALEQEKWDFVVLQQGPSASPEGRALLLRFAHRSDPFIRRAGAKPALYMVWPSSDRRQDFSGVSDSYRLAARDIGAALLPAGEAWRIAEDSAEAQAVLGRWTASHGRGVVPRGRGNLRATLRAVSDRPSGPSDFALGRYGGGARGRREGPSESGGAARAVEKYGFAAK